MSTSLNSLRLLNFLQRIYSESRLSKMSVSIQKGLTSQTTISPLKQQQSHWHRHANTNCHRVAFFCLIHTEILCNKSYTFDLCWFKQHSYPKESNILITYLAMSVPKIFSAIWIHTNRNNFLSNQIRLSLQLFWFQFSKIFEWSNFLYGTFYFCSHFNNVWSMFTCWQPNLNYQTDFTSHNAVHSYRSYAPAVRMRSTVFIIWENVHICLIWSSAPNIFSCKCTQIK